MLTDNQRKYIASISEDEVVFIRPYNPVIMQVFKMVRDRIHKSNINLPVKLLGSGALGISGNNDADISILCPENEQMTYLPQLIDLFGEPANSQQPVKWEFSMKGIEVELYLTDPSKESTKEQFKVMEILGRNPQLVTEYEEIKKDLNGKSKREYMKAKHEFFNNLLSSN